MYYLWFARQYWLLGLASTLSVMGVFAWRGFVPGLLLAGGIIVPTMIMVVLRRRGLGSAASVAAAVVVPLGALAINYQFLSRMLAFLAEEMRRTAITTVAPGVYTPDQQRLLMNTFGQLADKLPYYFPATLVFLIVSLFAIGLIVGNHIVRIKGVFARPITDFSFWKMPEWAVIPVGIVAIMVLTNHPLLAIIGWNALLFLAVLYSVCGLSLVEYALRMRHAPTAIRVAVYVLLFLTQLVAGILLPLLALFDSKFDFRKIRAKQLG